MCNPCLKSCTQRKLSFPRGAHQRGMRYRFFSYASNIVGEGPAGKYVHPAPPPSPPSPKPPSPPLPKCVLCVCHKPRSKGTEQSCAMLDYLRKEGVVATTGVAAANNLRLSPEAGNFACRLPGPPPITSAPIVDDVLSVLFDPPSYDGGSRKLGEMVTVKSQEVTWH